MVRINLFEDTDIGEEVKYYSNQDQKDKTFETKVIEKITNNQVILKGGMRFRKFDGSAIASGHEGYIIW